MLSSAGWHDWRAVCRAIDDIPFSRNTCRALPTAAPGCAHRRSPYGDDDKFCCSAKKKALFFINMDIGMTRALRAAKRTARFRALRGCTLVPRYS